MEPRVKLYVQTEESFPTPLKYIDFTRTTDTTLDTGFTRFTVLSEKAPDGKTRSKERLTRKQTTPRPDKSWPEMWKRVFDASKRKEKQKWAIEKPKLDNARMLRGIYFIDPEDDEFQGYHEKVLVESWKFRCQQQCLVKLHCAEATGKPAALMENTRQNTLLLLQLTNLSESGMEGAPHRYLEDHIAGKGMISLSHYFLVRKFILVPQAMKIPDAKAAVEKELENPGKYRHGI